QKSTYNVEPINNTVFGFNANYSTDVPFLTRLVNKLPNIDTDVESNFSIRGEFAYLMPGAPKVANFDGKTTVYVDDFESSQTQLDVSSPNNWYLSSTPADAVFGGDVANNNLEYNYFRGKLNWYTIDPIFYSSQRPDGINDEDLSSPFTRRIFRDEIFPEQDIIQGQTQSLFPLELSYRPGERGEYNFNPAASADGDPNTLDNPESSFGGISRQLTTTDFERSNVEYLQFWLMDPFIYDENASNNGGVLSFNFGNISEDVLKDGRKQYENGLPRDGGTENTTSSVFGKVPTNQSLIYSFDSAGEERTNQDIGYDGLSDAQEKAKADYPQAFRDLEDPAGDNYQYFLQAEGGIIDRYRSYNGTQGNSPVEVTNTNRGSTTLPDVEDINRDNTMNTVNSYFEYNIPIEPGMDQSTSSYITDVKIVQGITLPNNEVIDARWVQFKIPLSDPDRAINGISDFRSIRFMRMYLSQFSQPTVLRFGTLELVRGDWRRFVQSFETINDPDPTDDQTVFEVETISIEENSGIYVLPPGVQREQLNNNNNIIRQNEQSLAVRICGLEEGDARAVYKNFSVDMRQYENLEMFLHAESQENEPQLSDGDVTAFMRLGNDLTQNFYEVQIPLDISPPNSLDPEAVWPVENRMNIPLRLLQKIKSRVLNSDNNPNPDDNGIVFFDQSELDESWSGGPENELRIGIKGNPSFGNVRTIMLGIRNSATSDVCVETWFNELRLSELKNQGGWAAVASVDANLADFATISATGSRSTVGFGSIDQGPNQRSREDVKGYDLVTNLNLGQLLPVKWGVQLPFNYGRSEELITPQYDPLLQDVELKTSLDNAQNSETRDAILNRSVDYTKRQSINFIGVRKERTGDAKPKIYDIENFAFSYSYNQTDHRDFEIEESLDQNVRLGATYSYNFTPKSIEPFKKNDSLFTGKYWQLLKDFNINYLPTNVSVSSNIVRQYNEQKFREIDLLPGNIGLPTLYQRNFLFDWQYAINHNLTKSLRFNFSSSNNMIVKNYLGLNGVPDQSVGVWSGFFDVGTPNSHFQSLQVNYDLPFSKVPFLKFIRATYSFTGDFQWQRSSAQFSNIPITLSDGTEGIYNLGNTIQNASTHRINSTFDMNNFYKYIGLSKKKNTRTSAGGDRFNNAKGDAGGKGGNSKSGGDKKSGKGGRGKGDDDPSSLAGGDDGKGGKGGKGRNGGSSGSLNAGDKALNTIIGLATSIKKIQLNYQENNGIYLPGYTPSIGFIGTLQPTAGFTFGSQAEVRDLAARKGWLTLYPEFNDQYTEVESRQLDVQANIELLPDLKIDLNGRRVYSENYAENYIVEDDEYRSLTPNTFGNFNITTILIGTSFGSNTDVTSAAFENFRGNRLVVADRLATDFYGSAAFPRDEEGYPVGFGKESQDVLLPAFLSAYKGSDPSKEKTGILRDVPLPNWDMKYTGLMRLKWFKKRFRRFSIQHGYRADYTVNQFQTNLDFDTNDPQATDQAGNFKSKVLLTNINLTEQFSPLVRIDFEMKNSIKILAEYRKDRALSLSFANTLLTEIKGDEIIIGFGYRIKDLKIGTNFGGKKTILKSDLNFKLDISRRENRTVIRYLDVNNNQTTAGQTIYGLQLSTDYALSKNLTALFYYDHSFSEYAISTAFPQTTIRGGFTLRYNFGN
ncbi:MAG: T9SS outer membrane translocon Sov/SprA, partial [Flavobacteriales bacterium]